VNHQDSPDLSFFSVPSCFSLFLLGCSYMLSNKSLPNLSPSEYSLCLARMSQVTHLGTHSYLLHHPYDKTLYHVPQNSVFCLAKTAFGAPSTLQSSKYNLYLSVFPSKQLFIWYSTSSLNNYLTTSVKIVGKKIFIFICIN
jgi:hypothetical protein